MESRPEQNQKDNFQPADPDTQEEIGGILERAFQQEHGHTPNAPELERLLLEAEEIERRALAAEHLALEAEQKAGFYLQQPGASSREQYVEWVTVAYRHYREAYLAYSEDVRLRQYLLEGGALPAQQKLVHLRQVEHRVQEQLQSLVDQPRSEPSLERTEGTDRDSRDVYEELDPLESEAAALRRQAELLHHALVPFLRHFRG